MEPGNETAVLGLIPRLHFLVLHLEWSAVLVWLHIIRCSFSKKGSKERKKVEEENFVLVLVSQLKRKKGY